MRTVVLAGRRPDAPGAETPRFPPAAAGALAERLRAVLADEGAEALVASGACGADLLALDVAGALGLRRRMVLPYPPARFRGTSVVDRPTADGRDWGALFDRIAREVAAAGDLVVLDPALLAAPGADPFEIANDALHDEAARLAAPDLPVAVLAWDGIPRGADDHTAAFEQLARERGLAVRTVSTLHA